MDTSNSEIMDPGMQERAEDRLGKGVLCDANGVEVISDLTAQDILFVASRQDAEDSSPSALPLGAAA